MMNVICLMGRLVRDPDLRSTPNGVSTCTFTLAVDRNYGAKDDRKTDFIDVVAWRQTAEFAAKYLHKGSLAAVDGSLQSRQWQDKQGNNRTSWEVVADHVHFGESRRPRQDSTAQTAAPQYAGPTAAADDFTEIDADEDLPF